MIYTKSKRKDFFEDDEFILSSNEDGKRMAETIAYNYQDMTHVEYMYYMKIIEKRHYTFPITLSTKKDIAIGRDRLVFHYIKN